MTRLRQWHNRVSSGFAYRSRRAAHWRLNVPLRSITFLAPAVVGWGFSVSETSPSCNNKTNENNNNNNALLRPSLCKDSNPIAVFDPYPFEGLMTAGV